MGVSTDTYPAKKFVILDAEVADGRLVAERSGPDLVRVSAAMNRPLLTTPEELQKFVDTIWDELYAEEDDE